MSSNSDKQEEAISNLDEQPTAQPFAHIQVDTNVGESGEVAAVGQTGNVQKEEHGLAYSIHLLAAHLLMVENAYDKSLEELGQLAVKTANSYKDGREDYDLKFDFEKGWE